jgi:hypothetical protein
MSVMVMSIVISVMSLLVFLVSYLFFAVPLSPVIGAWPSYGVAFLIPSWIRFVFGLVAEGTVSLEFIRILTGLSTGYALLDAYSMCVVVAWIIKYYLNTLTPEAAASAGSTAYWFMLLPVLFAFILDVIILAMHQSILTTVPRELAIRGRMDGLSLEEVEKEIAKL